MESENSGLTLNVEKLSYDLSILFFKVCEITNENFEMWTEIRELFEKFENETGLKLLHF